MFSRVRERVTGFAKPIPSGMGVMLGSREVEPKGELDEVIQIPDGST